MKSLEEGQGTGSLASMTRCSWWEESIGRVFKSMKSIESIAKTTE